MNTEISVCIITNKVSSKLNELIKVFLATNFEICIGVNGMDKENFLNEIISPERLKLYFLNWEGYGNTKNKLAAFARNKWILSIDADEVPDKILIESLNKMQFEKNDEVYLLKRIQKIGDYIVRYGNYGMEEWKPRLYQKEYASWSDDKVHEILVFPKDTKIQKLTGTLWHYTASSLSEIRDKNNHYALLSATQMTEKGIQYSVFKPYFSGIIAFFKQYILKKGILDGKIGILLAFEVARYSFKKYRPFQEKISE
ncbi:MAG TPA: glycosyltransferase [Edaphocola sp.]|nr:glycosyltransferase [Edaphocola sp.]